MGKRTEQILPPRRHVCGKESHEKMLSVETPACWQGTENGAAALEVIWQIPGVTHSLEMRQGHALLGIPPRLTPAGVSVTAAKILRGHLGKPRGNGVGRPAGGAPGPHHALNPNRSLKDQKAVYKHLPQPGAPEPRRPRRGAHCPAHRLRG